MAKQTVPNFFAYAYSDDVSAVEMPFTGTKSLFNEYSTFTLAIAGGDHNNLFDGGTMGLKESKNPSAATIINWSAENAGEQNPAGALPYAYADFLYCKYYGLIPNNYLVTLRRYPIPVTDNAMAAKNVVPPMAQAVTWFGEETGNSLNDMVKFSCSLAWDEITADVQDVEGNEKGFEGSAAAGVLDTLGGSKAGDAVGAAIAVQHLNAFTGRAQAQQDYDKKLYTSEGPYANKVLGPINVVNKTLVRKRGVNFEMPIVLNFHYSLKSIGGINPKAAMLDLMANLLTITTNNAKFWGGATRYFPNIEKIPFLGNQEKFYSGDFSGYIDSIASTVSSTANSMKDMLSKVLSGDFSSLLSGIANYAAGPIMAKDRPQILSFRSLLTGAPVGEWHLVVGNPMNPIMMIGNLVVKNAEFKLSDKLGADDFPEELHVMITLEHGRPRDKGDIESMFNLGNGRLYYGIDDSVFSSAHNSDVDTSHMKGNLDNADGDRWMTPEQTQAKQADMPKSPLSKSMWGGKYNVTQLKLPKTWMGEAPVEKK